MNGATPTSPRLGWIVQYGLLAGPLLTMLDSSIVNVAVLRVADELHASIGAVQWTISGYLLALGAGLGVVGYLARRFGTLPVYVVSLAGFTLASVACAVASNLGVLIGARVAQGLIGAPLVPLAMSMLLGSGGQARAISPIVGIVLFLAPALGPTVGGSLIAAGGWRLIFLINIPVGIVATVAARRIPAALAPGRKARTRFGAVGLLLLAAGVTAVLHRPQVRACNHGAPSCGSDPLRPLPRSTGLS